MENVTLEKVDTVRDRTGVSYEKAKEALEISEGDVLEALIYIEKSQSKSGGNNSSADYREDKTPISIEELKAWVKQTVEKGNITRIKIKKDDAELIDIPVNAGIAAGIVAIVIPSILAAGVIAAIATQITIEITKQDGSVEVVNKYVSDVACNVKNKAADFADKIKTKVNEMKNENSKHNDDSNKKVYAGSDAVYTYTVNFDEEKENSEN
jgi:hypothetical protein